MVVVEASTLKLAGWLGAAAVWPLAVELWGAGPSEAIMTMLAMLAAGGVPSAGVRCRMSRSKHSSPSARCQGQKRCGRAAYILHISGFGGDEYVRMLISCRTEIKAKTLIRFECHEIGPLCSLARMLTDRILPRHFRQDAMELAETEISLERRLSRARSRGRTNSSSGIGAEERAELGLLGAPLVGAAASGAAAEVVAEGTMAGTVGGFAAVLDI